MTQKYLSSVQVLRGLAAMMVLIGHVLHEGYSSWGSEKFTYPFGVGVHIFFVISGFVIAYNSPKFFGVAGGVQKFFWRRILRIVPLYWFYTSLMLLALFLFPQALQTARYEFWHAVQSYFFIPHINPAGEVRPILSLGWTLNYEMYFYLIFAAFMLLPQKLFFPAITGFFIATVLIWNVIPADWGALKFWCAPIVLEFLAGAWIGHMRVKNIRLPHATFWPLCVSTVLAFGSLYFVPPAHFLPVMGLASVLIVLTATLPNEVERIHMPKLLQALGDSSYSLYLSHAFTIGVMSLLWAMGLHSFFNPYIYMIFVIFISAVSGHIAYWLIERPLLRLLSGSSPVKSDSTRI